MASIHVELLQLVPEPLGVEELRQLRLPQPHLPKPHAVDVRVKLVPLLKRLPKSTEKRSQKTPECG